MPCTWSGCQCESSTLSIEILCSLSVDLIDWIHASFPSPVSINTRLEPVPTMYVFVPCSVNYEAVSRIHTMTLVGRTFDGFPPRIRITRSLSFSMAGSGTKDSDIFEYSLRFGNLTTESKRGDMFISCCAGSLQSLPRHALTSVLLPKNDESVVQECRLTLFETTPEYPCVIKMDFDDDMPYAPLLLDHAELLSSEDSSQATLCPR